MRKLDEILTRIGTEIICLTTTKGGFRCLYFPSLFLPLGPAQGFSLFSFAAAYFEGQVLERSLQRPS